MLGEWDDILSRKQRALLSGYCKLWEARAGTDVCVKVEGSGAVLMREGTGDCESAVVRGRSPVLARCWFKVARVVLVVVLTNCCVRGGENPHLQ